ncbi:unnamed protein product [Clonostachys rosea]|uniref:F-box domain-containing protein n=1 Tax=Bionectria ochroleuca TaxID=29856 RepID=A0ABY6U2L9_BIOOC|nr:unnamed protein product [Clonostachys rosea]
MVAPILNMPVEILLRIVEFSTWSYEVSIFRKSTGDHAALVRTCRGLYQALIASLYNPNIRMHQPMGACVVWAACKGRLDTIKRAHVNGLDLHASIEAYAADMDCSHIPNICFSRPVKTSLIHLAILHNDSDIIHYLLEHGADVHAASFGLCKCPTGYTFQTQYPLHFILCHGDPRIRLEILEIFISKGAYLVTENKSAIPQVARITRGHLLASLIKREDKDSLAGVLHLAAQMSNRPLVTQICENPLSESIIRATDWEGRTVLHLAVNSVNWGGDVIRFLLRDNRASIFTKDHHGKTPLHYAATSIVSPELVNLLLQHRDTSDNTASTHFDDIFYMICELLEETTNCVRICQKLIDVWVKPLHDIGAYDLPLHYALDRGKWRVALKLIRDCIDLPGWASRSVDRYVIWTSLITCLSSFDPEQTEFVEAVLRMGCDLNYPRHTLQKPETLPIFLATVRSRNMDCLKVLLEGGASAKVQLRDEAAASSSGGKVLTGILVAIFNEVFGCPSLEAPNIAKMGQFHNFIALLLEKGALIGHLSADGDVRYPITALDYAITATRLGCFDLLDLMCNHATDTSIQLREVSASFAKQLNGMDAESRPYRHLKRYQGRLQSRLGLN